MEKRNELLLNIVNQERMVIMNYGRKLTAMGLAASVLMTQAGYASAQDALVKTENAE